MLIIAFIYACSCAIPLNARTEDTIIADDSLDIVLHDEAQPNQDEILSYDQDQEEQTDLIDSETGAESFTDAFDDIQDEPINWATPRTINKIIIEGNKFTPRMAIMSYIPFREGDIFQPQKSRTLIRNLYFGLDRFRNITVKAQPLADNMIDVIVELEEKPILKDFVITGNKQLSEKDILKKVDCDVPALDEYELKRYAEKIKGLYAEKGYNNTEIDTALEIEDDGKAVATLHVREKKRSRLKRIFFEGNISFSDSELKKVIVSQEDWLLGFLNQAGIYQPERLEYDKYLIEQFYQNHGFLHAKVVNVRCDSEPGYPNNLYMTYEIEEGSQYKINKVSVTGNDTLSEEYILSVLPIHTGDMYSREGLTSTIKTLEFIWGNHGYIFAHIEPSVEPDEDNKTVAVSFFCDLGNKITLNRLTIKGNKKTRDKVIRRRISLSEGDVITNAHMEISKQNVESLGYFDAKEGVNWKLRRIDDEHADLDLMLKESKTGNFNFQMGMGGGADIRSTLNGISVKGVVSDRNLFGLGINTSLEANFSREETTVLFHLAQPWIFDKPISASLDLYHKRPIYDELKYITPNTVSETLSGGGVTLGAITQARSALWSNTQILTSLGADHIRYRELPKANVGSLGEEAQQQYQHILDKEFINGTFIWLANNVEQDTRNHPLHPSRGFAYKFTSKLALGVHGGAIGFYKATIDTNYFTPIIGDYLLVLHIRSFLGLITSYRNHGIPFGELFHIGGQGSVRGFLFGQIGPQFSGDTIGATRAMFVNVELIFPLTSDMNMKGVIFYDGGAGWQNPNVPRQPSQFIANNGFDYRHSVGVGIRLLSPMPIRIDWGFKLDPRTNGDKGENRRKESASEVHFGMNYDW